MTEALRLSVWNAVKIDADGTDNDLAARFRAGEDDAFDRVVAEYRQRIARLVYRLTGWADESEDLVQDVFLRALQNRHQFRGDARLLTWLTTITVNACRSYHRRRSFRDRLLMGLWRRRSDNVGNHPSKETHEVVRSAVTRLPATSREAIVLRYFEELSIPEIAEILNVSGNAVEARLRRARRRLKETLPEALKRET